MLGCMRDGNVVISFCCEQLQLLMNMSDVDCLVLEGCRVNSIESGR